MSEYTAQLDLRLDLHAPHTARTVVASVLKNWGVTDRDVLDAASIVISELVTNALRHSGSDEGAELQVTWHGNLVRVALADGSAVVPRRREAGEDEESGRGLVIIDRLTARWGVEDYRGGKRVYADLVLGED